MFIMTSDIQIWKFINIKPSEVKWKCSISNYIDTCSIVLPLNPYVRNNVNNETEFSKQTKQTGVVFRKGDAVTVKLGYDYENTKFKH